MSNDSEERAVVKPETILIQVHQIPMGGATPQGVQRAVKEITAEQLKAVGGIVEHVRGWLFEEVAAAAKKPNSFSIEFGIDVESEAGIPFVTKGSIGANFKVSMEWSSHV